jgi:opacity protein-like surface antigen
MSRVKPVIGAGTLVLLVASTAFAAEDKDVQFKGYYKNLLVDSRTAFPQEEGYTLDLNRLRLELRGRPVEWFGYEMQYDNEALLGSYLDTAQFRQLKTVKPATYWDLEDDYLNRGSIHMRHRLYRGFVSLNAGATDLRLGRQRIAWGSGRLWNPTDILNPYNPTQLEREERLGVDALLLEASLGALSRLSAVYAPPVESLRASTAAHLRGNFTGTDVALMIGEFHGDRVAGLDLIGRLGDAGLYTELAFTRPETGDDYTRAVAGAEYAFANTLTVGAELYYNGRGTTERARYDFARVFAGEIQNVARRYVGAHLKYEFTPLLRTDNVLILNRDDASRFFAPSLVYSLATNWDVALGVQFFGGDADSEYGRFHDVYYTYVQWFF